MKNCRLMALIGALLLAIGVSVAGAAQDEAGSAPMVRRGQITSPQQFVERRLAAMTQQLGLSPEQQASIKVILEEEFAKRGEIAQEVILPEASKKVKLRELRESTFAKISEVLTPEQQQKQDAQRALAAERRKMKSGK